MRYSSTSGNKIDNSSKIVNVMSDDSLQESSRKFRKEEIDFSNGYRENMIVKAIEKDKYVAFYDIVRVKLY